ncbi:MAG TPA: tyrosine-type recombinase/integrase [Verrucomicrobiales bacterium]|nr:tyrosine-type recombinase/integrase [Verrucomicrobiales bacterium]
MTFEDAWRKARTARQLRHVIEEAHREITGEELPRISVKDYSERWLAARKSEIAPRSFTAYQDGIRAFLAWLGDRADEDLEAISRVDLVAYRDHRAATTSATTANNSLRVAKMLFRGARKDGMLAEDPSEFVAAAKGAKRGAARIFTMDQIRAVLRVADAEWKSLILFGLYTGQRLSDLAALTWSNLDTEAGVIRLTARKTGLSLTVPMAVPLRDHVATFSAPEAPEAPVHPRACSLLHKHGRAGMLSRQFGDLLVAAGLRAKPARSQGKGTAAPRADRGLKFHDLRATCVTLLHEAGIPLATVQALVGHSNDAVHQLYTRVGDAALRRAAESLPTLET